MELWSRLRPVGTYENLELIYVKNQLKNILQLKIHLVLRLYTVW